MKILFVLILFEYIFYAHVISQAPPIRVFLLNALGAGKGLHGRWLATKLGCFHLQFRARLQELLLPKLGYRAGDDQVEQDDHGVPSKLGPGETIGGGGGGLSGGERGEEEVEIPQNVIVTWDCLLIEM